AVQGRGGVTGESAVRVVCHPPNLRAQAGGRPVGSAGRGRWAPGRVSRALAGRRRAGSAGRGRWASGGVSGAWLWERALRGRLGPTPGGAAAAPSLGW